MSEDRSIAVRLRANFAEFNQQIDQAAQKASKWGQDLEAASRKAEAARTAQRDAAQQLVTAEKRLESVVSSGTATAKQAVAAQKEVERAKVADKTATEALANAEKQHAQAAQQSTTFMGRLAQSADQNSAAWNTVAGVLIGAGSAVTALGVAALKTGVDYNGMQQQTRAALTTLLGSSEAANAQMDKLDAFAKTSPFAKTVFIQAQQQMIAFGIATSKVIPYMQALNDATAAAGGTGQTLGEIAFVMAQISAAGKITGQDLIQFGQRGINAAELIGSQMGKTGAEIRDDITHGALDANDALDALAAGMSAKYGGAAANVKQTWVGATDRIKAAWRDLSAELAEPLVGKNGGGALIDLANASATLMRNLDKIPAPVKAVVVGLTGLTGVSGLAAGAIMVLAPRLVSTQKAVNALATAFPRLKGSLGGLTTAAKAGGIALGVAAVGLAAWASTAAEADAQSQALAETLKVVNGEAVRTSQTWNAIADLFVKNKSSSLGWMGVGKSVSDTLEMIGASASDAQGWLNGDAAAIDKIGKLRTAFMATPPKGDFFGFDYEAAKYLPMALDNIETNLTSAERQAVQLAQANKELGGTEDDVADSSDAAATALQQQSDAANQAAQKLKALEDAIWGVSDANQAAVDAEVNWYQTVDDSTKTLDKNEKAVKKAGHALSLHTQAGRDNRKALDDLRDSGKARINQLLEEGAGSAKVAKVTQDVRDEYVEAANKAGYYGTKAQELADKAGLIPSEVVFQVAADGLESSDEKLDKLRDAIKKLPKKTQTDILAKFHDDGVQAAISALKKIDGKVATTYIRSVYDPTTPHKGSQVARAAGGAVYGPGTETSDSIDARLSNGEHVLTASDVRAAGGQTAVYRLRAGLQAGLYKFSDGGQVEFFASGGAAAKKKAAQQAKANATERASLLDDLRTWVRRGTITDDVTSGSGLSQVDTMLDWADNMALSKATRAKLRSAALGYEKTLGALTSQLDQAKTDLDRVQGIYDDVYSNLSRAGSSLADLAQATTEQHTDLMGNVWYSSTAASASSIASRKTAEASRLGVLASKIDQLQKMGANTSFLAELAGLADSPEGVESAIQTADMFLSDSSQIGVMNSAYDQLQKYAGSAAQFVTNSAYEGGLSAAQGVVDTLTGSLAKLGEQMASSFASALGKQVVGLTVTAPKSTKKKASGGPVTAGELYQVNEQGVEMFRPAVNGIILTASQTQQSIGSGVSAADLVAAFSGVALTLLVEGRPVSAIVHASLSAEGSRLRYALPGGGI